MPALQCPDCGARHPLADVADRAAFRCSGCSRPLKVPEQFRRGAPRPGSGDRPVDSTRAGPAVTPAPVPPPTTTAYHRTAPPRSIEVVPKGAPVLLRLGLWLIAVPIALWLTYRIARGVGVLTAKQIEDVFFEQDWGRFWPLARLLPLWALLTALAVQLSVLGIERFRRRRAEARVAATRGDTAGGSRRMSGGRRGRGSPARNDVDEPTRAVPTIDDATRTAG